MRYSRHILLPDIGGQGQQRLLDAAVDVQVGANRAAEIAALAYLAAAGIGRLILRGEPHEAVTTDDVRSGILYRASDVGRPRLEAIATRATAINPDVRIGIGKQSQSHSLTIENHASDVAHALVLGGAAATELIARIARP